MDWRLNVAFPLLARVPTRLPWWLARWIGRDDFQTQNLVQDSLAQCFQRVFSSASKLECHQWAVQHLDMLAQEMVDAQAFQRLAQRGGPTVDVVGLDLAKALVQDGQGFILVLNHYDRLLTAPVALAKQGISSHVLTMPVMDNPDLSSAQRHFLLKKISAYIRVTGGEWRTTAQALRPVHDRLRKGGVWVILADAWRPEFARMRHHSFLGGRLLLPTGIERLAASTGVPMLHAITSSASPSRLTVELEGLPGDPVAAVNHVIQRLSRDVSARPWAWWHWGQLDQMWQQTSGEAN
jgi:KDO2-lipid IV(A) lauroyltransferase